MSTKEESRPVRIQRKRTKGWRMPPKTVYVGRPSKWGNPFSDFKHGIHNDIGMFAAAVRLPSGLPIKAMGYAHSVKLFASYCGEGMEPLGIDPYEHIGKERTWVLGKLEPLRGKNLACWCPLDQPCHGDILLELANQ